jgi:uncharacterized protein YdhG (YjbR/CyaY superfamily)
MRKMGISTKTKKTATARTSKTRPMQTAELNPRSKKNPSKKENSRVSPIDSYLKKCPEPQQSTLKKLRTIIRKLIPNSAEVIAYGFPAFKIDGHSVAGFSSFKKHCSYFPMSGSILKLFKNELAEYHYSTGALQFSVDRCLSATLVKKLIKARRKEINTKSRGSVKSS